MTKTYFAENSNTPPSTLADLALDENSSVRMKVARNPNTPPSTLEKLALDKEREVRVAVAKNCHTPPATLAKLSLDEYWYTRLYVAKNHNTPQSSLAMLVFDENSIRWRAAYNPNTPFCLAKIARFETIEEREKWMKEYQEDPVKTEFLLRCGVK